MMGSACGLPLKLLLRWGWLSGWQVLCGLPGGAGWRGWLWSVEDGAAVANGVDDNEGRKRSRKTSGEREANLF